MCIKDNIYIKKKKCHFSPLFSHEPTQPLYTYHLINCIYTYVVYIGINYIPNQPQVFQVYTSIYIPVHNSYVIRVNCLVLLSLVVHYEIWHLALYNLR